MDTIDSWKATPPARWHAFYVRVTQEESVKKDLSIPNQIARAREVARDRGWTDYRIYVEPRHTSAELWVEKRPAFRLMLEDIAAGRVVAICARHVDRFWRNNDIQGRLLAVLRPHRVEVWDFTTRHEYKSAHGRFALQVLGAASELEVNLTAERIREMKRGKALKGKAGGGPPPYGYTSQSRRRHDLVAQGVPEDEAYRQACLDFPVGKTWYVDEQEAPIVRLIFDLYCAPDKRWGTKRIVRHLNEQGHKTRNGHAWLSNYVRRIINNPAYAGFTTFDEGAYADKLPSRLPRFRQERFQGEHTPLISVELWESAQDIKTTENSVKRVHAETVSRGCFSLVGIIRCPKCDSRMVGKWTHHSSRRYYICNRRHSAGNDQCDFPLVDATALQHGVWNWLCDVLSSPALVVDHAERLRKKLAEDAPDVARQLAATERRQAEIRAAITKYHRLIEASDDPARDDALLDRVRELHTELQPLEAAAAELRAKAASTPPQRVSTEHVRRYLADLRARVDSRPEVQRAVFHQFKREHDLRVRAVSKEEFAVSIALNTGEVLNETPSGEERLFGVVATTSARGNKKPGSPAPGGPMKIRLCAPAAATSRARRAPCWPRTSARSRLAGPKTGR
jgi:site-specific DNA recombinase